MASPRASQRPPAPKYEEATEELENIVQKMEQGQLPLEESLSAYRRGAELLKHCRALLADAEERLSALDGDELKPLATDAGANGER